MSNPIINTNEPGQISDEQTHHQAPTLPRPHNAFGYLSGTLLERGDAIIYAIVGASFFLGAVFALGYSFWDFGSTMSGINYSLSTAQASVANAIIRLVSDLLLVLIIMEVLSTVIHYLKSHATSLHPFLFIGIISATRGILSIGARLSVETVKGEEFNHAMIELGVNALAILALGITLKLLGRTADDH
ncbi:MAG: phosphate-starvation-inducible PsiE family protein [Ktedonobacteraceae bacterium]